MTKEAYIQPSKSGIYVRYKNSHCEQGCRSQDYETNKLWNFSNVTSVLVAKRTKYVYSPVIKEVDRCSSSSSSSSSSSKERNI